MRYNVFVVIGMPIADQQTQQTLAKLSPSIADLIQRFAGETKVLLKDNIVAEYLFGSYATQTQTPLSDIDILIVVNQYSRDLQWKLAGLASDYSLEYDVCFSPLLQDMTSWKKHQQYQTLFYQKVTERGVAL